MNRGIQRGVSAEAGNTVSLTDLGGALMQLGIHDNPGVVSKAMIDLFIDPATHLNAHEEEAAVSADDAYDLPQLLAPFAPPHTGLTTQAQPAVYWYSSARWAGQVYFALNKPQAEQPTIEVALSPDNGLFEQGFHRIDLAALGVSLEKNVEYEWFVYIIANPEERTGDLTASATLMYVDKPSDLDPTQPVSAYARAGLWYDAVDALQRQLDKNPADSRLKQQRASLSQQAKMPKVADYDL